MSGRVVVLICGKRKRTYPVPLGMELQDRYTLDGESWTVVDVVTTAPNGASSLTATTPVARPA